MICLVNKPLLSNVITLFAQTVCRRVINSSNLNFYNIEPFKRSHLLFHTSICHYSVDNGLNNKQNSVSY